MPERMLDRRPDQTPERLTENMSDRLLHKWSEYMSDRMPGRMSDVWRAQSKNATLKYIECQVECQVERQIYIKMFAMAGITRRQHCFLLVFATDVFCPLTVWGRCSDWFQRKMFVRWIKTTHAWYKVVPPSSLKLLQLTRLKHCFICSGLVSKRFPPPLDLWAIENP